MTVYVTFGTLWNRDLDAFRVVLAALSAHSVDVVVTLGVDGDPAAHGAQPDNVHVRRFIAQAELLPRCDAVIAHGGAGTMLGALAHGLPLLVLPQGADQYLNGERVAAAGAGLSLAPAQATNATTARAVDTLLGDTGLRARRTTGRRRDRRHAWTRNRRCPPAGRSPVRWRQSDNRAASCRHPGSSRRPSGRWRERALRAGELCSSRNASGR